MRKEVPPDCMTGTVRAFVHLRVCVCVCTRTGEAVVFRRNAQHIDELLTIFC